MLVEGSSLEVEVEKEGNKAANPEEQAHDND